MLDRCVHDAEIYDGHREDFTIARAVTRSMVPNAVNYLVTTFFYPKLAKGQTTLVPPILRKAIIDAEPESGDHLVVYSSGEESALAALRASGIPCRVYGMRGGPAEGTTDGNLEFKPRSNEGFVEDLRTARGVVAGGGFSLMSESVYLGKPMLAMPLLGQFEQLMNSRYLEREGYGVSAMELTPRGPRPLPRRARRLRGAAGRLRAAGQRARRCGPSRSGSRRPSAASRRTCAAPGACRGCEPWVIRQMAKTRPRRVRDEHQGNRGGGRTGRGGSGGGRLLRRPVPDGADLRSRPSAATPAPGAGSA